MTVSKIAAPAVKTVFERTIIFVLAAVFIAQQLTHWGPLAVLQGILVFIAIALLLPQLKGMTLWLSVSFMAVGVILLSVQKADAGYWLEAAGTNVTLVTLFVFAPLFGIPVRIPAYLEALNRFYETQVRSRSVLFVGTQLLTQIMGVFLNVGSIPVVYHIVFAKPQRGMTLLLANALNRGFAGAILWSPYFAAMAVVVSTLSVNWSTLLPYMLGLSFISIVVSLAVDVKGLRHSAEDVKGQVQSEEPPAVKRKTSFPAGLGLYLLSAVVVVLVLERFVELPMVLITCMAAAMFPLIWCLAKGTMATYRKGLENHVTVTLPALKKEMTLFLAAGFFSGSFGATGFGAIIPGLLEPIPLPISITFSIVTIVLIMVTSMAGLHPIVPVTIFAAGIDPAAVHITPEYLAVLLLGSWGLSNTISPVSAVNNLLAGLYKKPVYDFAVPNYKFAACMAVMLLLYLIVIRI
ncbi:hypothetical protein KP806_14710 [Paenibacillus sp. N4]|uniref:hypothetical protein n=1 Tax=Paenibacillus vietnamensis TaxID=2590547 RepID=UPI001CD160C9|nr:hypothetical protein [Paenibacillus vietnamensis]MCA0756303.1 hypothetical protein [Paenibacillus vietnamensis]